MSQVQSRSDIVLNPNLTDAVLNEFENIQTKIKIRKQQDEELSKKLNSKLNSIDSQTVYSRLRNTNGQDYTGGTQNTKEKVLSYFDKTEKENQERMRLKQSRPQSVDPRKREARKIHFEKQSAFDYNSIRTDGFSKKSNLNTKALQQFNKVY